MNARTTLCLLIVAAAFATTSATAYAGETEAGLITRIEPPGGRYYVIRDGSSGSKTIDRAIVLREDDRIHLVDLGTRLTLTLIGEKNEVIVSRNNVPYPVKLYPQREWPWLSWFVRELAPREEETRITPAHIRGGGGDLSLHLFDKPQRIAAGRRSLVVAWNVGDGARVAIAIRPVGGQPLAMATTTELFWISPVLDLKPGFYTFEFRSEPLGHKEERRIEVIDPSRLARSAIDPNTKSINTDLQKTIEAGALASQGEGAFVLEAFQMVSPLATRLPAAKLLHDALVDGAWTEKLP